MQTVTDDNQSDEDFDKLKDETKEKDSPKKVKRDIKRTPKVNSLAISFTVIYEPKWFFHAFFIWKEEQEYMQYKII